MNESPPGRDRIRGSLLALGSAATVAVYAAGFARTRAAAERFVSDSDLRRASSSAVAEPSAIAESPEAASAPLPDSALRATAIRPRHRKSPTEQPKRVDTVRLTPDSVVALTALVVPPPPPPAPPPVSADTTVAAVKMPPRVKDGIYLGWGTSRHGDIEASVEIKDGRIVAAAITQCLTRYSCSWIDRLPGQVVSRQSAAVDYVSGATQSSDAFHTAIVEALSKAK
jgi:uncharacterized protein with FMN-binding domain